MKKLIIATMIIGCLALCAAVWPQSETVEKTPTALQASVGNATEPIVEDTATGAETTSQAGEERVKIPQTEPPNELIPGTGAVPGVEPVIAEVQPMPEPESLPTADSPQAVTDSQPGNMVYVPGFGWLDSQGAGEVIHDERIHENGNKVGEMR